MKLKTLKDLKGNKFILRQEGDEGWTFYDNDSDYNKEPIVFDGSESQSIILLSKEDLKQEAIKWIKELELVGTDKQVRDYEEYGIVWTDEDTVVEDAKTIIRFIKIVTNITEDDLK